MSEYNAGFRSYSDKSETRKNFRACEQATKQATIVSGQVLKKGTFLESNTVGKLTAHSGIVEKALVTFANITNGQTLILGGLTYTAGSGGSTKADIVTAFSGLAVGTTAAQANTLNPVSTGSFTSGTLTGYNTIKSATADSVLFVSTTPYAGVSDLADTGTATDPTITVTSVNSPQKPIAGVLIYDVNASSADVEATVLISGSFYSDFFVWSNNPASDTVENSDLTTTTVTDYYIGATTDNLKKKFVEGSEFAEIGILTTGETNG